MPNEPWELSCLVVLIDPNDSWECGVNHWVMNKCKCYVLMSELLETMIILYYDNQQWYPTELYNHIDSDCLRKHSELDA